LTLSGLSRVHEHLDPSFGLNAEALEMAENAVEFIRKELWVDDSKGTGKRGLRRSYREGPGPEGACEDYAFLIQGESRAAGYVTFGSGREGFPYSH
jgi:uncharacterized protein YyaL (SSP411 family)